MTDALTIFQSIINEIQKPLLEQIEAQNKRIEEMETFFAKWNFGNEEEFTKRINEAIDEKVNEFKESLMEDADDSARAIAESVVEQYDFSDEIKSAVNEIFNDKIADAVAEVVRDNLEISFTI